MAVAGPPRADDTGLEREVARVRALLADALARRNEPLADPRREPRPDPGCALRPLADAAVIFNLSSFERDVLLLALSAEIDDACARMIAALDGGGARRRVTVALVVEVLAELIGPAREAALAALLPGAHLVQVGLLTVDGAGPYVARELRVPDAVWPRLAGLGTAEVFPAIVPHEGGVEAMVLAPQTRAAAVALLHRLAAHAGHDVAVVVRGRDGSGRTALAAALAAALGYASLAVDGATLDDDATLRAVVREAGWLRAAAVITAPIAPAAAARLARMLSTPLLLITDDAPGLAATTGRRYTAELEVGELDADEREQLWRERLASEPIGDVDLVTLASRYRLGPRQVGEVVSRAAAGHRDGVTTGDLIAAAQALVPAAAGALARRLECRYGWEDLVLGAATRRELELIRAWCHHAPRVFRPGAAGARIGGHAGLVCLFAGPPGTGKTLAAQVLAGDLGLQLLRIDLSQVVNKYIGETEKNLDRVFAAAEASAAVLFFDEADALFGKRTEVKDAHDRYANLETSFLLQRLETHRGLVVLATNLRKNFDEAFLRRIHVVAEFPIPEAAERRQIWARHLADEHLADDVDLDFLARHFTTAGGDIRNAVVTAVLLAAADGGKVAARHLAIGLWRELSKAGRIVSPQDFGPLTAEIQRYVSGT